MYNLLTYFFKLFIICCLLSLPEQNAFARSPDVLIFTSENEINLRWRGLRTAQLQGYHVYVRNDASADWRRLTQEPQGMTTALDDIRRVAGAKYHLYLQLFGAHDPPSDITEQMLETLYQNDRAVAFMEIVSLINPEFGMLLGEFFTDTTQVPGTKAQYRITATVNGAEQELAVSQWVDCCDEQRVPPVEGLEATSSHQRVELSWNRNRALLTSGEVVTYHIYRSLREIGPFEQLNVGGKLPVTVASPGMETDDAKETHADRFLENGTTYYYYVAAVNAFGVESRRGHIIEATPTDDRMVPPPSNFRAELLGRGLALHWDPAPGPVKGYEIYRSRERTEPFEKAYPAADILLSTGTGWVDTDVLEGQQYHYFIRSANQRGIAGTPSDTVSFFFPRITPPQPPKNLVAEATEGQILLQWDPPLQESVLGYEIERSSDDGFKRWFMLNAAPHPDTFFIDPLPETAQTTFGYRVFVIDKSHNRSEPSAIVKARLPDKVPPQPPHITAIRREENVVFITWTQNPEPDFEKYILYRASDAEFEAIAKTDQVTLNDTLVTGGKYQYAVSAVDSSGNESEHSASVAIGFDPYEIVTPPASAVIEHEGARLRIQWEHSTHPRLAGYVITRIDVETGRELDVLQTGKETDTFFDRHSDVNRHYRYLIRARDDRWRMSEPLVIEHQPEKEERRQRRRQQ